MKTVELLDVSVQIRRQCALRDISLACSEGERIALFGPGGSGKTTLLRLLAGRISPTSGPVRLLQRPPRSVASRIGYAAEAAGNSLFNASQILAKSLAAHDVPGYQRTARATEALETLGVFEERERPVRELGSTDRSCVSLAAAIAHRPEVLLIDNITSFLPDETQARFWRFVDDRRAAEGLTVIHATTSESEAEAADRVLILDAGRALARGTPRELQDAHGGETLMIEAADPDAIRRTLRGMYDVVLEETARGLRLSVPDAVPAVAHLFRHPSAGFRAVSICRPGMWDVYRALRSEADTASEERSGAPGK